MQDTQNNAIHPFRYCPDVEKSDRLPRQARDRRNHQSSNEKTHLQDVVDGSWVGVGARGVRSPAQNAFFLHFSYACPEPVLAK
jgi:hypothetical protein